VLVEHAASVLVATNRTNCAAHAKLALTHLLVLKEFASSVLLAGSHQMEVLCVKLAPLAALVSVAHVCSAKQDTSQTVTAPTVRPVLWVSSVMVVSVFRVCRAQNQNQTRVIASSAWPRTTETAYTALMA
jgi:hypothetical protein